MRPAFLTTVAACALLAGCASTAPAPKQQAPAAGTAREAVANLASASGSLVSGKLVLIEAPRTDKP